MGDGQMNKYLEMFKDYMESERNLARNTISGYVSDMEQFITFIDKPLNRITASDVSSFITHLKESERVARSRNRKLSALRTFFRFMVRKDKMKHNPADTIEGSKVEQRLPQPIDEIDINKMIALTDNLRDKVMLEILYGAGIRREELVNLRVNDINFNNGFICVFGKGSKERYVPLHPAALDLIREHLCTQDSEWVFEGRYGSHLSIRQVNDIVVKYRTKVGLHKVTPHKFRHSFATHLYNNGAELKVIQDLMGHSNPSSTQVYTKVSNERNRVEYLQYHPRNRSL
jgi:integrase/recombinase XerD